MAKFISLLAQRVGSDIKPHSGSLLKVLFSAVKSDKSPAVRRAFAVACGGVAKYAGEPQVRWLLVEAAALYTAEGADKDSQLASALVLEQVSLQANEILKGHYTLVLPLAFIARFVLSKVLSIQLLLISPRVYVITTVREVSTLPTYMAIISCCSLLS